LGERITDDIVSNAINAITFVMCIQLRERRLSLLLFSVMLEKKCTTAVLQNVPLFTCRRAKKPFERGIKNEIRFSKGKSDVLFKNNTDPLAAIPT
jgi:hypothetical protein